MVVYDLDEATARRAGRIRSYLRRTGQMIDEPDIIIAATAIHHDLTLVTRNLRHFERIPRLQILPAQELA